MTTWSILIILILKLQVDKKSFKDILIYFIGYETLNGVKHLCINLSKINRYIEYKNRIKYVTLFLADENKGEIKKYKEIWIKMKCLIEIANNDLNKYEDRYMKFRFSSEDNLLLKQEL